MESPTSPRHLIFSISKLKGPCSMTSQVLLQLWTTRTLPLQVLTPTPIRSPRISFLILTTPRTPSLQLLYPAQKFQSRHCNVLVWRIPKSTWWGKQTNERKEEIKGREGKEGKGRNSLSFIQSYLGTTKLTQALFLPKNLRHFPPWSSLLLS